MRIKLNKGQAVYVFKFIEHLLKESPYSNSREKLIDILVSEIWFKLRNKLEQRKKHATYSIEISEVQALAFQEWIQEQSGAIKSFNFTYELNEVDIIMNQIDLEYGSINRINQSNKPKTLTNG